MSPTESHQLEKSVMGSDDVGDWICGQRDRTRPEFCATGISYASSKPIDETNCDDRKFDFIGCQKADEIPYRELNSFSQQ